MPTYSYKAKKLTGEKLEGEKDAASARDLARSLQEQGYILIAATEKDGSEKKRFSFTNLSGVVRRKVSLQEKLMFARNLGVMIRAGLALTRALDVLMRQSKSAVFKKVITDITERVRRGEEFASALKQHPTVFPPIFTAMVEAGETSGKLDESMDVLALQLRNDYELRRKVRGALMYPSVIFVVMIIIGILMLTYVVPTLSSTFKELKIELPSSTQFVISLSDFLAANALLVFAALPFIGYGIAFLFRLPATKRKMDVVIIYMPIIKELAKKINAARTSRTMASLISSGVPILQTLQITRDVLQNHLYKDLLSEAANDIQQGRTMTEAFARAPHLYPVLVSEMIAVGEETGKTADMLTRLAEFYEGEVAAATKDLSSIIEPFLMVIIGAAVGFFAISMITPLYTSMSAGF